MTRSVRRSCRHADGDRLTVRRRSRAVQSEQSEQVFGELVRGRPSGGEVAVRVLGVDPGLTRCGLGVIEGSPGRQLSLVAADVLVTPTDAPVAERLVAVEREIEAWLERYRPDQVAVERVFSQHNVTTVMETAQAGAVALLAAGRRGLPVALHTPSEVKAAVTGSGRAGKDQVAAMVVRLLQLVERPRPSQPNAGGRALADASDALALAICHLWRAPRAVRPVGGTPASRTHLR